MEIKKRGNPSWPHLPCYRASTHEDRGCFHRPLCQCIVSWNFGRFLPIRIFGITSGPVISVNQNLLTVLFLTNWFIIAVLLFTYVGNLEKEIKTSKSPITLGYSGFTGFYFPRVVYPACNKYHRTREKRLAARASELGLASSQNSLLQIIRALHVGHCSCLLTFNFRLNVVEHHALKEHGKLLTISSMSLIVLSTLCNSAAISVT